MGLMTNVVKETRRWLAMKPGAPSGAWEERLRLTTGGPVRRTELNWLAQWLTALPGPRARMEA